MFDWIDNIRQSWENLSERERKLLSALGGTFVALLVFGSVYTATTALSEVEDERDAIRVVLADIDRSAELLAKRDAERKAVEARFANKAPALAAYLEGRAKDEGIEVRNSDEEQAKTTGIYRRQAVKANFANVPLRPVVHLLTSIAQEASPLSIERLVIEHYAAGDSYKVDLGLASYEKQAAKAKAEP